MIDTFLAAEVKEDLVPWPSQVKAMERYGHSCAEVEAAILRQGLLPARYQRNRRLVSTAQQETLFRSRVAVIGCGGLGGYLIEELARLGVGEIVAVDPDIFVEHNLNRQLLATPARLGESKVQAAVDRVADINPAVTVRPRPYAFCRANAADLLAGVDVVADALDSVATRLELEGCCASLGIPLVHGAIAGWYGQVTTIFPGDDTLEKIYPTGEGIKGIETHFGNPAFTPALVASLQAAEVTKVLLNQGLVLRGRILSINLLDMEIEKILL